MEDPPWLQYYQGWLQRQAVEVSMIIIQKLPDLLRASIRELHSRRADVELQNKSLMKEYKNKQAALISICEVFKAVCQLRNSAAKDIKIAIQRMQQAKVFLSKIVDELPEALLSIESKRKEQIQIRQGLLDARREKCKRLQGEILEWAKMMQKESGQVAEILSRCILLINGQFVKILMKISCFANEILMLRVELAANQYWVRDLINENKIMAEGLETRKKTWCESKEGKLINVIIDELCSRKKELEVKIIGRLSNTLRTRISELCAERAQLENRNSSFMEELNEKRSQLSELQKKLNSLVQLRDLEAKKLNFFLKFTDGLPLKLIDIGSKTKEQKEIRQKITDNHNEKCNKLQGERMEWAKMLKKESRQTGETFCKWRLRLEQLFDEISMKSAHCSCEILMLLAVVSTRRHKGRALADKNNCLRNECQMLRACSLSLRMRTVYFDTMLAYQICSGRGMRVKELEEKVESLIKSMKKKEEATLTHDRAEFKVCRHFSMSTIDEYYLEKCEWIHRRLLKLRIKSR